MGVVWVVVVVDVVGVIWIKVVVWYVVIGVGCGVVVVVGEGDVVVDDCVVVVD